VHRYSYLIANARTDPGHRQSFDEAKFEKYHCGSRQAVWETDLPQWYG
jgi:hypothetical protein